MGKREREEEAIGVADAGRGEENHTLFLFSSSSSCCCGSDCNCVCNYVDDSSSIVLDPDLSSESGLQDDQVLVDNTNIIFNNYSACDSNGAGLEEDINHAISIETTDSEEGSGFSADFYRCGTNWSSLLPSDNENGNQNNDHSKPMQREPRLNRPIFTRCGVSTIINQTIINVLRMLIMLAGLLLLLLLLLLLCFNIKTRRLYLLLATIQITELSNSGLVFAHFIRKSLVCSLLLFHHNIQQSYSSSHILFHINEVFVAVKPCAEELHIF